MGGKRRARLDPYFRNVVVMVRDVGCPRSEIEVHPDGDFSEQEERVESWIAGNKHYFANK